MFYSKTCQSLKMINMHCPNGLTVLWICMSFFFIVSSEQMIETRLCRHFDHNKCRDDPTQCNHTVQECDTQPGKRSGCYTTHKREGNKTKIILEGCWANDDSCSRESSCRAKEDKDGIYFCCCEGDYCNTNVTYLPMDEPPTTPAGPMIRTRTSLLSTLLFSLLPLLVITAVVICGFWLYKRHKRAFNFNTEEADDIEAKAGKDTILDQCVESPLLSNGVSDICSSTQLLEVKATGRFGRVWKAQMRDQIVAVKEFPFHDQDSFLTERDIYSLPQIHSHDNILSFLGTEKRHNTVGMDFWLITEFHDNGSLYDHLKRNLLTWKELMKIAYSMAKGLAFLHDDVPATKKAGRKPAVAHRDFKSKNVLVKADMTACIADFGLALKFEPGKSVGDTHGQVGTRRYMAPEVLECAISFNRDSFLRIDMYACGLVLWELAGRCSAVDGPIGEYRQPFEAEVGAAPSLDDMQEVVVQQKKRPELRECWSNHLGLCGLRDTIEECWDHDPEARLSAGCVEERLHQLQLLTDNTSSLISPPPPPAPPAATAAQQNQANLDNSATSPPSRPTPKLAPRQTEVGGHSSGYSSSFEPDQLPGYTSVVKQQHDLPPNHTLPDGSEVSSSVEVV